MARQSSISHILARLVFIAAILVAVWAWKGPNWMILDDPQEADAIVVLAGETEERPHRALELFNAGLASRLYLNVPSGTYLYGTSQIQLAEQYLRSQPSSRALSVCPIAALSTRDEARDVAKCIEGTTVHSVLLVTSEFHTHRALLIFQHELPGREFHVAAAYEKTQFGVKWWQQRQWAKTFVIESLSIFWWNFVDRWR